MLNLGLSTNTEIEIDGSLFSALSTSLHEKCPLLFEIVECLLLASSQAGNCKLSGEFIAPAMHLQYYVVLVAKNYK